MKLESFFEKFDLLVDSLDAVSKLRALVLHSAMMGKLTERDLKNESVGTKYYDEPASEALPANWRLLNFGTFCDIQGGNQPPKSQFIDTPRAGYVRMFQIRDLGEKPVPVYIAKDSTNRFCREGEILIGRYGASVGKVFWAQNGAYNVALAKFIFPDDAFLPTFAFWVLRSHFFQDALADASRSAQAGFNKGDLAAIDFPLPPLTEQGRIVAKVNELMALCDRLEAQQKERETRHATLARAALARFADAPTPANLEFLFHKSYTIPPADLRKSILTLAVQGKLVPQDPIEKGHRIAKADAFDEPFEVPASWQWIEIADLQPEFQNGASSRGDKGGVPIVVLRLADIKNRRIDLHDPRSIAIDNKQVAKYRLEAGDTLITRVNGSADIVGTFIPVEIALDAIYCDHFIRMRVDSARLAPAYTALVGESELVRDQIRNLFITTAGQKTVNQTHIRSLRIPLPPLAEQRRIVAKLDELMALVDTLEMQLATARTTGAKLVEALVTELTAEA